MSTSTRLVVLSGQTPHSKIISGGATVSPVSNNEGSAWLCLEQAAGKIRLSGSTEQSRSGTNENKQTPDLQSPNPLQATTTFSFNKGRSCVALTADVICSSGSERNSKTHLREMTWGDQCEFQSRSRSCFTINDNHRECKQNFQRGCYVETDLFRCTGDINRVTGLQMFDSHVLYF